MSHTRRRYLAAALVASLFFTPSAPAFAFTDLSSSSSLFPDRQEPETPEQVVHDVVPDADFRAFLNTYYFNRADAPDAAISSADMETLTVIGSKLDGTTYPDYYPEGFHRYRDVEESPIAAAADEVIDMLYIPTVDGETIADCGMMCFTFATKPNLEGLQYATNLEVLAIANPGTYPENLALPKLTHLHVGVPRDTSLPTLSGENFPALTSLHAYGNTVEIAPEAASLQGLTDLEISARTADVAVIAQLPQLKSFSLKNADITELPAGLTDLKHLEILKLNELRELTVLPEDLGNLTTLRHLDIGDSTAAPLPDSATNLTNLEYLKLNQSTTGLPNDIGNLTSLKEFDSDGAIITELPTSFTQLTNLEKIHLQTAGLKSIPEDIGNLSKLSILNLSSNQFSKVPDSIGDLTNLEILSLGGSAISELPDSIGNLTNLKHLDLQQTRQLSALPDSIGNLSNLEKLWLGGSSTMTSLPDTIGNLSNLRELFLINMSNLTLLPETLGNLTNLEELTVRYSGLTALPESFKNLTKLRYLDIAGTKVSTLPEEILEFPDLQMVTLFRTNIPANDPVRLALKERGLVG